MLIKYIVFLKVASNPFFNANQRIPKINPVSTPLLQTLNRDPRLRKVENIVKASTALNDDVKHPILKSKEDKKLDKSKRDNNKHRDSKRKERSPSHSPSKKELSRKSHKKTDRKERSPRDDKYHKRRDDKKNKELEVKKKGQLANVKVLQNESVTINCEPPKVDKLLIKEEEPLNDNLNTNATNIQTIESNVPKEKVMIIEVDTKNEANSNNSANINSEHSKNDTSLEDSDSLKRLRMYMQTMKKSPEPTAPSQELKNESDINAVKSNQSKIKMSDQLYFIIKFIVGDLLLFLNKLDIFLRHKNNFTFPQSPIILIFFLYSFVYEWFATQYPKFWWIL